MGASDSKSLQGFGFLTALEDEQQGWIGGLLVLNSASRPLEFHCTAPVKPSRAQQILYGSTLGPYICGEQIGAALTNKSSIQPAAYFTDVVDMLTVRELVNSPVALVNHVDLAIDNATASRKLRIDGSHSEAPPPHAKRLITFNLQQQELSVCQNFAGDEQKIGAVLQDDTLDLSEPFQRIREALEETQLRRR